MSDEELDEDFPEEKPAPKKQSRIRRALSAADKALLDEGDELADPETEAAKAEASAKKKKRFEGLEDWQLEAIPTDLPIPKDEEITVLRFKSQFCKGPAKAKGDRTCVIWPLSVKDERIARTRMFGDPSRGLEEMTKMMVRAIDGEVLNPSDPQQVERFWDEIGPRHRSLLVGWYQKTHNFNDEERLAFFVECVAVRTAR